MSNMAVLIQPLLSILGKVRGPKQRLQGDPWTPPLPSREARGQKGNLAVKGAGSARAFTSPSLPSVEKGFILKHVLGFTHLCHRSGLQLQCSDDIPVTAGGDTATALPCRGTAGSGRRELQQQDLNQACLWTLPLACTALCTRCRQEPPCLPSPQHSLLYLRVGLLVWPSVLQFLDRK